MKILKWFTLFIVFVVTLVVAAVFALPHLNDFNREGRIALPGLKKEVKVVRDENGMAYIYAGNMNDLIRAQGYVTAQDRIFQMELTRLFANGRISELVGPKGKKSDMFMRTIGFYRQAKRHEKLFDKKTRLFFQNYVDGINGWIAAGRSMPIEFAVAGIKPTRWTIADSLAILYFMGWNSAANVDTEIIAQMLVEKLGETKAREIFPINVNPDDPVAGVRPDNTKTSEGSSPKGMVNQTLLSLLTGIEKPLRIGSNNWATSGALSKSGKPIVANDPHLDARVLPGPWYPCGLITPQGRAIGVAIPGIPGMVAGRNDHIAVGVTNAYGDTQDLYIETVDTASKGSYLEGGQSIPFEVIKEKLRIKDSKVNGGFREEKFTIRLTRRGPVITDVLPGLKSKKVITLRWASFETMCPSLGVDDLMKARSVEDMRAIVKKVTPVMLNFVFADKEGHIGWQASGRLPIRARGDGTIPLMVTDDGDDWEGWVPPEVMPGSVDPQRGWLGTCNHMTVSAYYPYYYTSYVSPSWRYRRLSEVLDKPGKKTLDDHWSLQRDTTNVMARQIAPVIAKALSLDPDTKDLGEILQKWDFQDRADQAAPLVFHRVYEQFAVDVFKDELGEELCRAMIGNWYFWQERLQKLILDGDSEWFDDIRTPNKEGRDDLFLRAAKEVLKEAKAAKEKDPGNWKWGKSHQVTFVAPLFREGIGSSFLGAGTNPMDGAGETLYRASYVPGKPQKVTLTASLRMVIDLGDNDKIAAVLPGGVSGRQFTRHFHDQTESFLKGDKLYWWFSDRKIAEHKKTEQTLFP
jgi:penicillin amidase